MSVKVYSTPTCPFCTMAKNYLKQNEVSYEDVDVSKDREQAMDMIKKSGQRGVPVIDYDGEIIVGFDKKKLIYPIYFVVYSKTSTIHNCEVPVLRCEWFSCGFYM